MAARTRQRMIEGATRLLAVRGLQETSFSEVLHLTGAPRGSIYHHFPDGKDQLIAEAVDFAGARAIELIDSKAGSSAEEITRHFLEMWRQVLTRSDFRAGCSVLAVTIATDSGALLDRAATVFRTWRSHLAESLRAGGLSDDDARGFAAVLIAASEGAVALSRAERNLDPFDLVAGQLRKQVRELNEAQEPG